MSARVGVVLSGCGFLDGTEIHEAVSILIALDRRGAQVVCMAPDVDQVHVVNHRTGQPANGDKRNVLTESARIARGKVRDIAAVRADELDALVFPGGYGAAKNLSTFAADGPNCRVNEDVARLTTNVHAAGKPIGFACISPVIAAKLLGHKSPSLTIGTDPDTAQAIERMGARHHPVSPADVCIDARNRIVTTPCYMNDVGPWVVFQGAERMVEEVLRMTGDTASLIRGQMATLPHERPLPNVPPPPQQPPPAQPHTS
jgi:enhancing lycopene biosynthesis protein 2